MSGLVGRANVALMGAGLVAMAALQLAPSSPSQGQQVERGRRIYVLAVQDSQLFTLCPPTGESTVTRLGGRRGEPLLLVSRNDRAVSLWARQTGEWAHLPLPPTDGGARDAMVEHVELHRPAPAPEIQRQVEAEFARQDRYRLVESADEADYVFLVEALHVPVARYGLRADRDVARPTRPGAPRGGLTVTGGDRPANLLQAVFALAVPSDAYRQHVGDIQALLAGGWWRGLALSRRPVGDLDWAEASAASLVGRFLANEQPPEDYPPICAASDRPLDAGAFDRVVPRGDRAVKRASAASPAATAATDVRPGALAAPTFRTNVVYVQVPAVVVGSDRAAITGLQASDFRVYENDVEQSIDRLVPTSVPFDVALVVDTSASMRLSMEEIQLAILGFTDRLRTQDRLMLVSFDERVFVEAESTGDRSRLRRAVVQMAKGLGTRLYDAVDLLASAPFGSIRERKAIVLFTDGVDTQSRLATAASSQELAADAELLVYVVEFDPAARPPAAGPLVGGAIRAGDAVDFEALDAKARDYLQALAATSGGALYRARTLADVKDAFTRIAGEIGEQYTLSYYPSNQARDGTYRTIRVEVGRPGARVRARAGYKAAPPRGR